MGKAVILPGLTCCRLFISRNHEMGYIARSILADHTHVHRPRILRQYESVLNPEKTQQEDGLWVYISAQTAGKNHRNVVKNWLKRRFEAAFFGCLTKEGFQRMGRKRVVYASCTGSEDAAAGDRGEQIEPSGTQYKGTVDIQLSDNLLKMKGEEVNEQAAMIVGEILRQCQNSPVNAA